MSTREDKPRKKKWGLWRSALYGFILAVVVFIVHNLVDSGEQLLLFLKQARLGQIIGDLGGRLLFAPLLFVVVAFVHNRFVKNSN
jgi:H+/Cl- antiporter ClcA